MNLLYEDRRLVREQKGKFIESNVKLKFKVRELQYELRKLSRGKNIAPAPQFLVATLKEQIGALSNELHETRRNLDCTIDKLHDMRLGQEMAIKHKEDEIEKLKIAMQSDFNNKLNELRLENERVVQAGKSEKEKLRDKLQSDFNNKLKELRLEKERAVQSGESEKEKLRDELRSDFNNQLKELRLEKENAIKIKEEEKEKIRTALKEHYAAEGRRVRFEKENAATAAEADIEQPQAGLNSELEGNAKLEAARAKIAQLQMSIVELEKRCENSVQENIVRSGKEMALWQKVTSFKKNNKEQAAELERLGAQLKKTEIARTFGSAPNVKETGESAVSEQEKWLELKHHEFVFIMAEMEKGNISTAAAVASKKIFNQTSWKERVAVVLERFKIRFEEAESQREIAEKSLTALKSKLKRQEKLSASQNQEEWLAEKTENFARQLAEQREESSTETGRNTIEQLKQKLLGAEAGYEKSQTEIEMLKDTLERKNTALKTLHAQMEKNKYAERNSEN